MMGKHLGGLDWINLICEGNARCMCCFMQAVVCFKLGCILVFLRQRGFASRCRCLESTQTLSCTPFVHVIMYDHNVLARGHVASGQNFRACPEEKSIKTLHTGKM